MSRVMNWTIAQSGERYGYQLSSFGDLDPNPSGADRIYKFYADDQFRPDNQIELEFGDAARTEDRWLTAFGQNWQYVKVSDGRWRNQDTALHDAVVAANGTTIEVTLWDDGVVPGPTVPTTDSFGPVSTNQDGAVETWAWEESSNGSDWGPVGTILTHVSGADTNTLTVDRATVAMHQTYVRCRAETASQTTWSDPAQVLIDGEPI